MKKALLPAENALYPKNQMEQQVQNSHDENIVGVAVVFVRPEVHRSLLVKEAKVVKYTAVLMSDIKPHLSKAAITAKIP